MCRPEAAASAAQAETAPADTKCDAEAGAPGKLEEKGEAAAAPAVKAAEAAPADTKCDAEAGAPAKLEEKGEAAADPAVKAAQETPTADAQPACMADVKIVRKCCGCWPTQVPEELANHLSEDDWAKFVQPIRKLESISGILLGVCHVIVAIFVTLMMVLPEEPIHGAHGAWGLASMPMHVMNYKISCHINAWIRDVANAKGVKGTCCCSWSCTQTLSLTLPSP